MPYLAPSSGAISELVWCFATQQPQMALVKYIVYAGKGFEAHGYGYFIILGKSGLHTEKAKGQNESPVTRRSRRLAQAERNCASVQQDALGF